MRPILKIFLTSMVLAVLAALPLVIGQEPAKGPDKKFQRGAKRTPPHKIADAMAKGTVGSHRPTKMSVPTQCVMIPPRLSVWGNDQYGDCVTAESAAAIAAYSTFIFGGAKEIFIPEANVINWARSHGVLNGADLLEVIQSMQADGIKDENGVLRKAGKPSVVNFTDEASLKDAISQGPLSIAIAADALPSGAGNKSGWFAFGSQNNHNTDHCVSLLGYGPCKFLFEALGAPLPANAPPNGYLLFTWETIGVVDHAWIKGTTDEAWLRTPTIIGLPTPGPPDPPDPPIPGVLTITPATVTLLPKATQQFTASLPKVVWLADGGTITQAGLYTAPDVPGTAAVAAFSLSPFGAAQVQVTITNTPPPPVGPTITLGSDLKAGTYTLVKPGMEAVPAGTLAELERIRAALNRLMPVIEPPPAPKAEAKPQPPQKPIIFDPEPGSYEEQQEQRGFVEADKNRVKPTYEKVKAEALKSGKRVVIGIGCPAPNGEWLTWETEPPWLSWNRRCVVVMQPKADGFLHEVRTLPPGASSQTIQQTLSGQ